MKLFRNYCGMAMAVATICMSMGSAYANGMLAADNGMTLYSFDKDANGQSACYDKCAARWPPYLAKAGQTKPDGWTRVKRNDGAEQWAVGGKPLYFYADDHAAGDATGDGVGGVWHVVPTK